MRFRCHTPTVVAAFVVFAMALYAGLPVRAAPLSWAHPAERVRGNMQRIDLSRTPAGAGAATVFAGLDTRSTEQSQYLTGGLDWQTGYGDVWRMRATGLRMDGSGASATTHRSLLHAGTEFTLGRRWYIPSLSVEMAQAGDSARADDHARAVRASLNGGFSRGEMSLGYVAADPDFAAQGLTVWPGPVDQGMELSSRLDVGLRWRLRHELQWHAATERLGQRLTVSHRPDISAIGRPWRLATRIEPVPTPLGVAERRYAIELSSATRQWRDWRLDTGLGWYDRRVTNPDGLPVDGGLLRLSAARSLRIAGVAGQFKPFLGYGDSAYARTGAVYSGLGFGLARDAQRVDLDLHYESSDWTPARTTGDEWRMMLRFTRRGAFSPAIREWTDALRLPWQRRR